MGTVTFLDLERKIQAEEAYSVTLDRLFHDQKLSAALKLLQQRDLPAASQRLDVLLCGDILAVNSQLESARDTERTFVADTFARIARVRPRNSEITAEASPKLTNDQIEAEKILMAAGMTPGKGDVVTVR